MKDEQFFGAIFVNLLNSFGTIFFSFFFFFLKKSVVETLAARNSSLFCPCENYFVEYLRKEAAAGGVL